MVAVDAMPPIFDQLRQVQGRTLAGIAWCDAVAVYEVTVKI